MEFRVFRPGVGHKVWDQRSRRNNQTKSPLFETLSSVLVIDFSVWRATWLNYHECRMGADGR